MIDREAKSIDFIDYLNCPDCGGTGRINGQRCQKCQGVGMAKRLDDLFLYWNRKISRLTIFQNQVSKTAKTVINGVLLVFGLAGIAALGWKVWQYDFTTDPRTWISLVTEKSVWLLIFWLSVLTDLYLYYRFARDIERQQKIKKRKYRQQTDGQYSAGRQINDWLQFAKWPKDQKIEVSGAYSETAFLALEKSYLLAKKFGHKQWLPIHLLAALLPFSITMSILARLEIDFSKLKTKIISELRKQAPGNMMILSVNMRKSLIEAYALAYKHRKNKVGLADLFLALVEGDEIVENIFYDLEVEIEDVKNVVLWASFNEILRVQYRRFRDMARQKPKGDVDRAMTAMATPILNAYGQSLTTMAKLGYFGATIGREQEIEEVFRIIESGGLRNVILVGEQGVGKTAIIEALAQRMATEEVPEVLYDKRLVSVNVATLVGGATPDQAQGRLLQILDEVTTSKNVVLVIEDIKGLAGITAGGEQSIDLLGILAKALSTNTFFCIATASSSDYVKYIEENSVLMSIFQVVDVAEVDKQTAIQILESRAGAIEHKNQVYFSYESILKSVELSVRFIHDRFLPAKALNVIEEAAVLARKKRGKNTVVKDDDVAEIVAQISNVPTAQVGEEESKKLLNLEERIHQRLVGQEEAVKMVSAALRRARTQLSSAKRPIANLMFLGPTGVGKTELAKTIAEVYFDNEKNMIRLDMSEYQGASSLQRLLGYGTEGGFLTEAIRKKPFSLVLLDEIEKADKNVLNLFLQVMEDGRMTDNSGRVVDFTNAIIIATSNAGTQYIQEQVRAGQDAKTITDGLINNQLKTFFRPEFLNRFDGVIVFKPLTMDEMKQIARLMLKKVAVDLEKRGVGLQITDEAVAELATLGYDPTLGARPLRRVIQEKVRDVLANYILSNQLGRRDTVIFDVGGKVNILKPKR